MHFYVRVRHGGKLAVLRVVEAAGGGSEEVTISPLIFGHVDGTVTIDNSSRVAFRRYRLWHTGRSQWGLAALAGATASAVITASFAAGKAVNAPTLGLSGPAQVVLLAAAALLALLPGLAAYLVAYWLQDDPPDRNAPPASQGEPL